MRNFVGAESEQPAVSVGSEAVAESRGPRVGGPANARESVTHGKPPNRYVRSTIVAAHPLPHGPSGRGTDSPSARHKDVKARAYLAGVSENAGECHAARWPFATAEIMLPRQVAATVGGAE